MVSIDSVNYFICYISVCLLVLQLASRFYLGEYKIKVIDLFFVTLAISCIFHVAAIIEVILFTSMSTLLFKEVTKFKQEKWIKITGLSVIALNSCVLLYIQTNQIKGEGLAIAAVWFFLSQLITFPLFTRTQPLESRIENGDLYHFLFRFLMVLIVHKYVAVDAVPKSFLLVVLVVFALLACISMFYKKVNVSRLIVQSHISVFLSVLAFAYPLQSMGTLLLVISLLYVMDINVKSLQSHNRRWVEMLEWPTWLSAPFMLLIFSIYGVAGQDLLFKATVTSYLLLIGAISVFGPEKTKAEKLSIKESHLAVFKSVLLVVAIVILERMA